MIKTDRKTILGLAVALAGMNLFGSGVSIARTFNAAETPNTAMAGPQDAADTSKVDLNAATEKELDGLPGVGPATAKKIIAGRPYASVADLSKAGISATTIKKITPLVKVGNASGAAANSGSQAATPQPSPAPSPTASTPPAKSPPSSASRGNPGPGMVWVNLDSRVYHYEGSRYYGKTKNGKYLSEAEAIQAGYRAAKNEKKPN
jgi:Helix-hairpin-helix motif